MSKATTTELVFRKLSSKEVLELIERSIQKCRKGMAEAKEWLDAIGTITGRLTMPYNSDAYWTNGRERTPLRNLFRQGIFWSCCAYCTNNRARFFDAEGKHLPYDGDHHKAVAVRAEPVSLSWILVNTQVYIEQGGDLDLLTIEVVEGFEALLPA